MDWAQGGVAELFTQIRENGYHILYLSARAIAQAATTKDYLQGLEQVSTYRAIFIFKIPKIQLGT